MNKTKSINFTGFLSIVKSVLIGLVITLLGVVVLAILLKFTDLNTNVITWINNVIKGISIFFIITQIKRKGAEKLLIKAIISGVLYAVLSFLIFSILSGGFNLSFALLYDIAFAVIVSIVASILINLLSRKA